METSATETQQRPPWGGFGTFWNFLQQLHDHRPIPQVLDRAVMSSRGGSTRTELYVALRFFGLMSEDKKPTQALHGLIDNLSPESFRPLVEERYKPIIDLDLRTATPSQVGNKLSEIGSQPSTVIRARTFFMKAAEHVGVEVGNTLLNAPSPPRRKPTRKPRKAAPEQAPPPPAVPLPGTLPTIVKGLVERLPGDGETWNAEDAEQWLALARPALAFSYGFQYEKKVE